MNSSADQWARVKNHLRLQYALQPTDATLTEKDIEATSAKIVEKVVKATGGTLARLNFRTFAKWLKSVVFFA